MPYRKITKIDNFIKSRVSKSYDEVYSEFRKKFPEYFAGVANIGGTVTGGTEVTLSSYTSSGGGPGGRP